MKIQERTGAGAGRSAAPARPAVGERLPAPPRERKPALAALAVLLILVGALGATMLVLRAGDRIEVVRVTKEIQAGESVNRGNTASVMVAADDSVDYVPWAQLDTLGKLTARTTIYAGTVVVGQMFAEGQRLPEGKASVGLALKEGQYPADIKSGDTVAVYDVGGTAGARSGSGSGSSDTATSGPSGSARSGSALVVADAQVSAVRGKGDATVSTGNLSLTLLVGRDDAAAVARAASAGTAAVVIVPGAKSGSAAGDDGGAEGDGKGDGDGGSATGSGADADPGADSDAGAGTGSGSGSDE
ncbi:hypothetical protein ACIPPJ_20120 [Streptomyces sp. NPDC086091]|uniref:hypothetical protein n=1 Tax=Streptomyces sp. NPDC086091 TaxID=3365751 RepID=UPI0038096FB2